MDQSLRVCSFNIRYGTADDGRDHWSFRRPFTLEQIARMRPHLMGLQEALSFQIIEILTASPNFASVGVGRENGFDEGEFSPVLYDRTRLKLLRSDTFWFSDTPSVPGSSHWGNDNVRICTWAFFQDQETGDYFYHYNIHIDHEVDYSRRRSVELLVTRINDQLPKAPTLVTGDFNVGESNAAVRLMAEAGFRDSFREIHPSAKDVGTFHLFGQDFQPDKIDYIFVDPSWTVSDADIWRDRFDGRFPSDHYPVTAALSLGD